MPKLIRKARSTRQDKKNASPAQTPETTRSMETYGPEEQALFQADQKSPLHAPG